MPFRIKIPRVSVTKTGEGRAVRASRLFWSRHFGEFLLADFVLKSYCFRAIRPSRGRDGAALRVQRQPRRIAVRPSLQSRKALTATTLQPFGKTMEMLPFISVCK